MDSDFWPELPASQRNAYQVAGKIMDSLQHDPGGLGWNNADGEGKILFLYAGGFCEDFDDYTTPKRYDITLEIHVTTQGELSPCGDPEDENTSCTWLDEANTWQGSHQDRKYAYIILDDQTIGDTYRHTINHESGHVLGLADPSVSESCRPHCGTIDTAHKTTCLYRDLNGNIRWVESIMHSNYYCGSEAVDAPPYPASLVWPSGFDRISVSNISHMVDQ